MMVGKVTWKTGPLAGSVYYVKDESVIGSHPDCAIQLRSGIVSARHARIFIDSKKGLWTLEDMKSFNGTTLDGQPVTGKKRLKTYHVIVLANKFELIFQLAPEEEESQEPPAQPETASEEDKMARTILLDPVQESTPEPPPVEPESFVIVFKTTKAGEQSLLLKQGQNSVGRSATNDIVIDNPSISRHHAVVTVNGAKVTVKDGGSRNGTFVDDRRISNEVTISPDNELKFGLVQAGIVTRKAEPRA